MESVKWFFSHAILAADHHDTLRATWAVAEAQSRKEGSQTLGSREPRNRGGNFGANGTAAPGRLAVLVHALVAAAISERFHSHGLPRPRPWSGPGTRPGRAHAAAAEAR